MGNTILLIPAIVVLVAGAGFLLFLGRKKRSDENGKSKGKDRQAIIKEANRSLGQNPRDAEALKSLGDVYYQDEEFDKSNKTFELLVDLVATNKELDEFEITMKYAISALHIKRFKEAYKALLIARTMKQDVFEVNYNLGYLEYMRKNYEKSAALLSQARVDQPERSNTSA